MSEARLTDASYSRTLDEPSPRLYRLTQAEYQALQSRVFGPAESVFFANGTLEIMEGTNPPFDVFTGIPPVDILTGLDNVVGRLLRRITVAEYKKIIEYGLLNPRRRNDLVEGWLVEKFIFSPQHYYVIDSTSHMIRELIPASYVVRTRAGITLDESMTDPDVSIVQRNHRGYANHHPYPSEIELLIEIGVPSGYTRLAIRSYARNRIRRCWFLDLNDRSLLVQEKPSGAVDQPEFRERTLYKSDQSVPLTVGGEMLAEVSVAKLFGL